MTWYLYIYIYNSVYYHVWGVFGYDIGSAPYI